MPPLPSSQNQKSRSPSPPCNCYESPRRRIRSQSPPQATQHHKSSWNFNKHRYPNFSKSNTGNQYNNTSGFQNSAGSHASGVCTVCLGQHEHNYPKCNSPTEGLILCFDWQLPAGCRMSSHPEKHCCVGCGKTDHGAQSCPQAEKK